VNMSSYGEEDRALPLRWKLAILALSAIVASATLVGCGKSELSTKRANSPETGLSLPVTFIGEPGEKRCEALQASEPSSSYKAFAPMRSDTGDDVTISGVVMAYPTCQLVSGATVEFWYADKDGLYKDNLRRGRLITDIQGAFNFSVEMPGSYTDGNGEPVPSHVHIWVSGVGIQARGMTIMTNEPVVETEATVVMPTGV